MTNVNVNIEEFLTNYVQIRLSLERLDFLGKEMLGVTLSDGIGFEDFENKVSLPCISGQIMEYSSCMLESVLDKDLSNMDWIYDVIDTWVYEEVFNNKQYTYIIYDEYDEKYKADTLEQFVDVILNCPSLFLKGEIEIKQ